MFRDIHPDLPVLEVRTLAEHASAATFVQRLGAGALAAFGALALLLSGVGVFGVMAYSVLGSILALGMANLVRAQLIGVGAADSLTYLAVGFGLLGVGAAAAWVPALRASRVNPLVALGER